MGNEELEKAVMEYIREHGGCIFWDLRAALPLHPIYGTRRLDRCLQRLRLKGLVKYGWYEAKTVEP